MQERAPHSQPGPTSERVGYWAPATDAQVEAAAAHGFDLGAQDKYFASVELDNRNRPRR